MFAPWRTVVIYYLRPQHEFVESNYLQHIHEGGSTEFELWLGRFELDRLSWRPVVANLRASFGDRSSTVGSFGEIRTGQNEFLRTFLRRVNPALDPRINYPEQPNASVGALGLEIALAVNPQLATVPVQLCFAANDVLSWSKKIGLTGQLRRATPKTIRHRLLHIAARITPNSQRLHLDHTWPWTATLTAAIDRIRERFQLLSVSTTHPNLTQPYERSGLAGGGDDSQVSGTAREVISTLCR